MVGEARLSGLYVDVLTANTIAALRPVFLHLARALGYLDFDAATLKSAWPRELTQRVSTHLYALTNQHGKMLFDGVHFASRHGDELVMWAIFERPGDEPASRLFNSVMSRLVHTDEPDLARAMALHGLTWR